MKVLLHLPHTSLRVPHYFYKGLTISKEEFRRYNLEMTDLGVNHLFKDLMGKKIRTKYSRLFCDVERFRDDNLEAMAKFGEGVIYTRLYDGKVFHSHDLSYRKRVLRYYDRYHKRLDKIAKRLLKKDEALLILDLHSYSDKMASHFFKPPFPDICIGVEKDFYDEGILNRIINRITALGYSYQINYPYKGSLVPNTIYSGKTKGKVISIMLEVNKRIYL